MRKVLIIDPDQRLLKGITSFLYQNGFDVIETKDGASGVQKALEFLPDIILCNLEITGLSGYEVFNTLKQINSTAIIPFVFLLDKINDNKVRAIMNMGVDDYIEKPVNLNNLLTLIKTRLKKQEKIIGLADEKFNSLMEFSSDGIFIYSDEKFNYVNKRFCEIFLYEQKHLLGVNLVNIVYKDDITMVADKIERTLIGIQHDLQFEFRAIRRNQEIIQVSLSGSLVRIRGKNSIIGKVYPINKNRSVSKLVNHSDIHITITKREREILCYICDGFINQKIAQLLNISERTVEGHRINLLKKTECRNSARLAVFAVKHGLYKIA